MLIQIEPYSIAEKEKEDTESHKIDELYRRLPRLTVCYTRRNIGKYRDEVKFRSENLLENGNKNR